MLHHGRGLGTIVYRPRLISIGMLAAAANALPSLVAVRLPEASLLSHIDDLRRVAVTVAVAVAEAAAAEMTDIVQQVEDRCGSPNIAGSRCPDHRGQSAFFRFPGEPTRVERFAAFFHRDALADMNAGLIAPRHQIAARA